MNAIDTNVFAYLLDAVEPAKQAKARTLILNLLNDSQETILLWQVAAELLNCLRKWESRGKITNAHVAKQFNYILNLFPLCFPTKEVIANSFDLKNKYSLSHWDSMILAACKVQRVDTLYSEDLSVTMNYDGIKIVNPFN